MPFYNYECSSCFEEHEFFLSFSEVLKEIDNICKHCGKSGVLEKIVPTEIFISDNNVSKNLSKTEKNIQDFIKQSKEDLEDLKKETLFNKTIE